MVSCHIEPPTHSFYYWRTELSLDQKEQEVLQKSKGEFLFIRFFDVIKQDGKFQPVGIISVKDSVKISKKIVPVIFITNQTWFGITESEIKFLAKSIHEKINEIHQQNQWDVYPEIQIDSDWTASTQKDYFLFLKKLKSISQKNISCTLRLHQIKEKEKTGIPPVDHGYLMCYATSSPLENLDKNSILDVPTLQNYLNQIEKYPLPFTVALPIYSWGIVTNHLGQKKLINGLSVSELSQTKNLEKISETQFEVMEDGFYFGMYLNKGYRITVEEISEDKLLKTISFLSKKINLTKVVYYHLDSKFVKNYSFFK